MEATLAPLRTELEAAIATALRQRLMTNRASFAPFRAAPAAAAIVGALSQPAPNEAEILGRSLGKEGLSLASLTAAQTVALEVIVRGVAPEALADLITVASQRFGSMFTGQAAAEYEESQRQRDEIERAFRKTMDEQRVQEDHLRDAIRELSAPIIPVYKGILALPLIGSIDSHRAMEITESLLEAIARHHAEIVILDITGVSIIDTNTANHLLMTTRAVALLGSRMILTGINPEIAQSIVQLGIDLQGLVTLANLQAGITYALRHFGLAVQSVKA